ncbi:MAG TPA: glycosyltransferase family 39 protein [Spirochaetota bacterium]|nr:glycosyltransferase family 39 protein [Spirochaetota bacterium]HOM38653.1 glycosyltransferase family 39 protein [Spirochaetota bacterium]HPQ49831.1 glycosyltransferase family 39 protein [Spirochaetota bacterium]
MEEKGKIKRVLNFVIENRRLIFLMSLIFIFRIPTLYQHIFDIDESVFSEFASKILHGAKPYIDVVDNKPILNYYFFYAIYYIFGENLLFVHLITTIIVMITGFFVYLIGLRLKDRNTGIFSLISFLLLSHIYEPKYISTNGETIINLLFVIGFYLFIESKYSKYENLKLFVIGILTCGAFFIRYHALFFILGIFLYEFFIFFKEKSYLKNDYKIVKRLISISSGFLFALFILVLIMIKKRFFDDFLYWTIYYNHDYIKSSQTIPLSRLLIRVLLYVLSSLPVWFFAFRYIKIEFFKILKNKILDKNFILLLIMFILSFLTVIPGKRAYGHYFILIIVFLSLLSGSGLMLKELNYKIITLIFIIFPLGFTLPRIDLAFFGKITNNSYEIANTVYKKVGEYIKLNTDSNDKIFAWGFATPIYYYSSRNCLSRFIIADFLSGRIFGTKDSDKTVKREISDKVWNMFWDDIKKYGKPKYFIDTSPANFYSYSRFKLEDFKELYDFVISNYYLENNIENILIYKLKN